VRPAAAPSLRALTFALRRAVDPRTEALGGSVLELGPGARARWRFDRAPQPSKG
jgi:hypothetical protein